LCHKKKEEMEDPVMKGKECWEHIPEDKKKLIKAKLDFKMKKVQAKLDFLKEFQRIFGYAVIVFTIFLIIFKKRT
jgi:hypothetical protein